mmetsp:Transcript_5338/g.11021  ORF Transcript_5338/g.11021 Transcript_5338/m.11021 type:complete len:313 (+) Transcript_5338:183-1121(+)
MPPNALQLWDLNATKRHLHDLRVNDDDENDHYHDELTAKLVLPPPVKIPINDGRSLWKKLLHNEGVDVSHFSSDLMEALSSIIVLDDEERNRDWLNRFGGRLHKVSSELLEGLRTHAPDLQTMSTVADFNDNLCYHMQQERGLRNFGSLDSSAVQELEDNIQANEYLGSFLTTKSSLPQPAHVDYPWEVLQQHGKNLRLGFFPLTEEGMFLQVWPTVEYDPEQKVEGQLIFIPKGTLLTVPASTIHGGGFRTTNNDVARGNLRFHLYIATNSAQLPAHQTNKYTEPNDRRKELSRRCVDSKLIDTLMENFFV